MPEGMAGLDNDNAKMAAVVADVLRQRIYKGYLRAGDRLISEKEMVVHFGVSRPTIREALRILEAENLISIMRGGGGVRVRPPDAQVVTEQFEGLLQRQGVSFEDLFDARRAIEPQAAAHLAIHATREALQLLEGNLVNARAKLEVGETDDAGVVAFAALVVEHCGSKSLRLICQMLQTLIRNQIRPAEATLLLLAAPDAQAMRLASLKGRESLVQAVRDRNPELAASVWRKRIDDAGEYLVASHNLRPLVEVPPAVSRSVDDPGSGLSRSR